MAKKSKETTDEEGDDSQAKTLGSYDHTKWQGVGVFELKSGHRPKPADSVLFKRPEASNSSAVENPFPEGPYTRFRKALHAAPRCESEDHSRVTYALKTLSKIDPSYEELEKNTSYALYGVKKFGHAELQKRFLLRISQLGQNLSACMTRLEELDKPDLAADVQHIMSIFKQSGMASAVESYVGQRSNASRGL